ncbi:MAG: hypothetical protein ABI886_05740 [Betaproteobacteria bacterium]
MVKNIVRVLLALGVLAGIIWVSDRVTLEGERTVYGVDCKGGEWRDEVCAGRMTPGPLYRFRASRTRQEVIFWIAGSAEPSGKYTDCMVRDRGNWTCNRRLDQPASIAYEMIDGVPTRSGSGLTIAYHAVPKWKWWALRTGLPLFSEAD